jgi:hypothetical protein
VASKRKPLVGNADGRPRIEIWGAQIGGRIIYGWSHGPTGMPRPAPDPGAAVNAAMEELGGQPAVIIYRGIGA